MNDIMNNDGGTPDLNDLFKRLCNAIEQLNLQNGDDLKQDAELAKKILSSDECPTEKKLEVWNDFNEKFSKVCSYRADAQKQLSGIIKAIAYTIGFVATVGIIVGGAVQICNSNSEAQELAKAMFD